MSAVEACADRLVLRLYIQPKASRDSIVGLHGDELKVAITAPVDGGLTPIWLNSSPNSFVSRKAGAA